MNERIELTSLWNGVKTELETIGLGKHSLRNYYYEGMLPIIKVYNASNKNIYDVEFTAKVVEEISLRYSNGDVSSHINMHTKKVAVMLEEYFYTGKIQWKRILPPVRIKLSSYFEEIAMNFRADELKKGIRTSKTIREHTTHIRKFFKYLEDNAYQTLENITLYDINCFLIAVYPKHPRSMDSVIRSLKYLNGFLVDNEIKCVDFSVALIARPALRKKINPAFSKEEVTSIFSAVDENSPISKRDKAIFAIAESVGLRAIDVSLLKLSNICWETHEIKLSQHKTMVEIVLPLRAYVGNLIADYILNERPKSECDTLFLRARAPHIAMTATGITDRLRVHMKKSGIGYVRGDKKGFHSYRRYVASQMLNEGVPMDTVKDILGHTKINSLKPYARISEERLRSCAISLKGIEVAKEELL